ncbi:MAG: TIGR00730 family Rossman fold protein [Bacteroidetes Order II. Incertae sedis bacterium]|nr:TIGR00730 family Rossman fold protein [Bacteroidetes Order II. bacterium]
MTDFSLMDKKAIDEWQTKSIQDTWRIFRIMSEFVEGFQTLSSLGPCVTIFGSARLKEDHPYYHKTVEIGQKLVERGFGVITGGGPGLMEAANRGASQGKGVSVGLNITLPHEQFSNPYVDPDKLITFDFFFARKVMFVKYAMGFIAMPGGFGTLDELFESLTLVQTGKARIFPIVLVGKSFWEPLVTWIKSTLKEGGFISPEDLELIHVTDDSEEVVNIITDFYKKHRIKPNF